MKEENQPGHPGENIPEDATSEPVSETANENPSETLVTDESQLEKQELKVAEVAESDASPVADPDLVDHSGDISPPSVHAPVPATEEQFMEVQSVIAADENHDTDDAEIHEQVDLSSYTKEDLVGLLENYVDEIEVPRFKSKIADIRDLLNQHFSHEKDELLARFIEEGGLRDDFQPAPNELEERFHKALRKFNKKRIEFQANLEKQRQGNLDSKKEILGLLKDLIQNEENMNKAFDRFHELQAKWRSFGPVPSADVRDLQLTYKFLCEKFYDYIKINRELQELDQRRNLDAKLLLCEQAEELYMESSINTAFKKLHMLQDKWRETGPVSREKKNEVWDRFKAACDKVFEKRGEFIKQAEEQRAKNLEVKSKLCEDAEALKTSEDWKHKEWQEATHKIGEIQAACKKTGPADKKNNDTIWARFRTACDLFYKAKNDFYHKKKQELSANLQLKTELCIQAEALKDNTDWRTTTAELKRLQDEWKKIGHVGERQSEKIWKRFRTACDVFFKNKSQHFSTLDKEHDENLLKKISLIEQIENYVSGDDTHAAFEELKGFQRSWSEMGMVPLSKKEEINGRYKVAIDAQFDKLKSSSSDRPKVRYQSRPEYSRGTDDSKKMDGERRSLVNKITELKNDVQVWENNIGFFAKSKNAEKLKMEFEEKISKARQEIAALKEKLDLAK